MSQPPTEPSPTPPLSVPMRLLKKLWEQRSQVARFVHGIGFTLAWMYDKFPLPRRVKDITTELTFHAIEHFIVQSQSYQNWLHRKAGLTRLHGLFSSEKPQIPAAIDAPSDAAWNALLNSYTPASAPAKVVVIIPVYKGYDETMCCLFSVLIARNDTPYALLVINDASPDHKLATKLESLAAIGCFELITHTQNQGFVKSVNEGMQHAAYAACDVVLLNADTQVYDGWLDRMHAALYRHPRTASVTPFSNNGELVSYPRIFHGNVAALEVSYATLDALAATANAGQSPELPTAVGFCMLMRREALTQIGWFDEDTFGRGYGEENDWCLRAADLGFRHVLAADIFVRHTGAVSFEGSKRRELRRSLKRLNMKHPHYRTLVRAFRDEDPLKPLRRSLDIARLQNLKQQHSMVMVSHNAGGGTERHIQDMVAQLEREGTTCYRLNPDSQHASRLRLWHGDDQIFPNLVFDMDDEIEDAIACFKSLEITHLHVHHLLGFAQRMCDWVALVSQAISAQYDVTIHDYYYLCPSINLVFDSGSYEGDPSLEQSQEWAQHHPTAAGRTPIWLWRYQHALWLGQARSIFAPSADCAGRMERHFKDIHIAVRPHPETPITTPSLYIHHTRGATLDIAVIGRLTPHKGADVIVRLAKYAHANDVPIHYHIFGDAQQPSLFKRLQKVTLHGAYEEHDIYRQLAAHRCHMALIPSVWPETYTYTLSIALHARMYPVSFDLGAPAERIRNCGWGHVLPLAAMHDAAQATRELMALSTDSPPQHIDEKAFSSYANMRRDYYGLSD